MHPINLVGTYEDAMGREEVRWTVRSFTLPGQNDGYGVTGVVRGVPVSGPYFDALEPESPTTFLSLNGAGELDHCVMTGRVSAKFADAVGHLDLRVELSGEPVPLTTATLVVGDDVYMNTRAEDLEVVLGKLATAAVPHQWECCLTCGLSDYWPAGQNLMGMRCHRDAREQYLNVQSKWDYFAVPVTEEVPEFYVCEQFEPRKPGTGYRG